MGRSDRAERVIRRGVVRRLFGLMGSLGAALLGAGLLETGGPAAAEPTLRVLFVGNSFTRQHDVPARVAARAEADGISLRPTMLARDGARLSEHLARGLEARLAEGWDAVVVQGFSTEALYPDRAARAEAAFARIAAAAQPAPVVLFQPWPRAPGHRFYAAPERIGFVPPGSPAEMAARVHAFYARLATATGADLAPVGLVWARETAAGARLYAADRYHANPDGAALAAREIWAALRPALGR
ncbi:MAG: hypothetical protein ACFBSD_09140 [Paracoccaceae bacterium]